MVPQNNTKNTSLKHEYIADLSDSTFETINQGRKKLRTGQTQFIRTNSNNMHTYEYNNNMKQTQLYTEPNDSNINDKNSNLIRKQNNYIGSIQKTTKINSQQNKINQNPGNVKNYRNNKQNQNHNINKFQNNTTTHSTTTYYEKGTNQNI